MDDWRQLVERLQRAMVCRRWSEVAAVAEQLQRDRVERKFGDTQRPSSFRHPWLRWIGRNDSAIGRSASRISSMSSPQKNTSTGDRFLLWVDALGGYLVCLSDEVVLGRAGANAVAHVPILGDCSARHAVIRRDAEGYWLEPVKSVRIDGRPIERPTTLADGQTIELGDNVRLRFRRPHPLSATARLESASCHRTQPAADGVLLMADACILGSHPQSHVVLPDLESDVVLYRQGSGLACRGGGTLLIDNQPREGRGSLSLQSRVVGDNFSFTLEAL